MLQRIPKRLKPLELGRLFVPESVYLAGDRLRWQDGLAHFQVHLDQTNEVLDEFRALPLENGAEFYVKFAQKWGPLGLCRQHGLPCSHSERCMPRREGGPCPIDPETGRGQVWSEPLDGWRSYVAQCQAVLRVAAALQERGARAGIRDTKTGRCSREDWLLLGGWDVDQWAIDAQPTLLAQMLNRWLSLGAVKPLLVLGNEPTVYMAACADCGKGTGTYRLFGTLAWRLVLTVCRSDGLGHCNACGTTYVVTGHRPRRGSRTYCPQCRKGRVPHRDAQRDYTERRRNRR